MRRELRSAVAAFLVLCLHISFGTSARAQEHSATRSGFTLPTNGNVRILVFRPRIRVGAQSTGGMNEPNADWTAQARQNISAALAEAQAGLGNRVVMQDEPVGQDAHTLADHMALFSAVADSVIRYQFFRGNRLPTKKRDNRDGAFEWTLGSGVAALPGAADADFALFIYTDDYYGSVGRKIFQVLAAVTVHVAIQSGIHKGFAGLVDLRTGNLVWLNADLAMGGDVRTLDGARRRVAQLLEHFPGSTAQSGTRR